MVSLTDCLEETPCFSGKIIGRVPDRPDQTAGSIIAGGETLSPIVVGPCEPGQTLTGAALSIVFSGARGDSLSRLAASLLPELGEIP